MATVVAGTATVGAATPTRFWQWKGVKHYVVTLWSGPPKPVDLNKPVDHAAWARVMARKLSFIAMFLFSFGSLTVLGGQQLTTYAGYAVKGRFDLLAQNFTGIAVLLTVMMLIFLMDLLMIVKCVDWIDKKANGESFTSERSFVWFVAVVEAITYTILLAGIEHPASVYVTGVIVFSALAAWGMILLRAVAVPIVAVSSATLGDKVVTEKERTTIQIHRTDNALAASMNMVIATPAIDNIPMLTAYRRYLNTDTSKMTAEQLQAHDEKMFEHIQKMAPGVAQKQAQEKVTALIAQHAHERDLLVQSHQSALDKAVADAEQRMADATRAAEEKVNGLLTNFIPMMVNAITDNAWPAQLLAMSPVFEHIEPHTMIQQAGYHVTTTPPSVAQFANLQQPQPPRNPMAPPPATDDDASATAGLRPIAEREPPRTTPPTGASTPAPRRGGSRRKTTTEDNQS